MKKRIYLIIGAVVVCAGVLWSFSNGDARRLLPVELAAAHGGCGDECSTGSCPSKSCYWHGDYYKKDESSGNTVADCDTEGNDTGCDFYGDYVLCVTTYYCTDSGCTNCGYTTSYGLSDCRAIW